MGLGGGPFGVEVASLLARQVTLMTSWTLSLPELVRCVEFAHRHSLPIDRLFTDRWQIDQAAEAYRRFDLQSGGKGVFLFE